LISSSIPGEGKTALAQSLAAFVGLLGRRALLVDLDFQQGSRPGEFDDTGERGIVHLSLQNRPAAERILHVAEAGFDYLTMPTHRLDPLTFPASEQVPELIRQLREQYDCVIIDSRPVLRAAEARLLLSIVDRLLFVVKWGSTRREVAQNALSLLHDSGPGQDRSDFAMAIVTQVDLKRHARYRYGDVGGFLVEDRNSVQPRWKPPTWSQQRRPMKATSLCLASLLHRKIPKRRIIHQDLKTLQPSGPKAPAT